MPTHGNALQKGFPDLYAVHDVYGQRWIEVKNPNYYSFTRYQLKYFPQINKAGIGIWILIDATIDEYKKLFDKKYIPAGNWQEYLRAKQLLGSRNMAHYNKVEERCSKCNMVWELTKDESVNCFCGTKVVGKGRKD